ncbi:Stp1/IreP family PP2C-type Ser/Thr phosphatase [Oscillospiraceae bacterium HV4-5-C5C]|nr:Stp1/IreP family PP2C-type Ser/Thr phosphatase [Oscillospiraceae bacterium HV4-5-C5C]
MSNRISFAARTDVGLTRKNNEDSFVVLKGSDDSSFVVILADGMGGHQRGELASSTAVRYTSERLAREIKVAMPVERISHIVQEVVERANVKVYLQSLESTENSGMGTTLTVGVFASDQLIIGHIGDCRVYRLRQDRLDHLTRDHTLVQALVDRGDISTEQAKRHPRRNVVTRALGSPEYMQADTYIYSVERGDRYLFSSDGLHDYVNEEDIKYILVNEKNPETAVDQLIELANRQAGVDNVTVICGFVQ